MRLDKFLVDCGLGSRSQVKTYLKKKQVTVNGQVETSPKTQIDEKKDQIAYQGQELTHETFVYYLLNKPKGVISATEDARHKTVLDLLDETARHKQVFPVGRLDLAHAMLSPRKHVDKIYQAKVAGVMDEADMQAFEKGIELKDHTCQPAKLEILSVDQAAKTSTVQITIAEGKFHQVKRMVAACGKEVTDLQRLSMGSLVLPDDLEIGTWRRLTQEELDGLNVFGIPLA